MVIHKLRLLKFGKVLTLRENTLPMTSLPKLVLPVSSATSNVET